MKYFLSIYILVLVAGCSGCKQSHAGETEAATFVLSDTMMASIRIDTATMRPVESELRLSGKVTPDMSKVLKLYPLVSGYVKDIKVQPGDYVKKGQALAVIQAGTDQNIAEEDLKTVVTAPVSGYVIEMNINNGMKVRQDSTAYMLTISKPDDVWIMANVSKADISRVKEGSSVEVTTVSYPDKTFKGQIDDVPGPDMKTTEVRISLDNEGMLLKPEMFATILLRYREGVEMPAIPTSALILDKGKNFVIVFRDKYNVDTREVEVSTSLNDTSYIRKGLQPGEKIISRNQLLIYDALND